MNIASYFPIPPTSNQPDKISGWWQQLRALPSIKGFTIDGSYTNTTSGTIGINYGPCTNGYVEARVRNFVGPDSIGIKWSNGTSYNEENVFGPRTSIENNTIGLDIDNGSGTNSFGYNQILGLYIRVLLPGQIAVRVHTSNTTTPQFNGAWLYNTDIKVRGNISPTTSNNNLALTSTLTAGTSYSTVGLKQTIATTVNASSGSLTTTTPITITPISISQFLASGGVCYVEASQLVYTITYTGISGANLTGCYISTVPSGGTTSLNLTNNPIATVTWSIPANSILQTYSTAGQQNNTLGDSTAYYQWFKSSSSLQGPFVGPQTINVNTFVPNKNYSSGALTGTAQTAALQASFLGFVSSSINYSAGTLFAESKIFYTTTPQDVNVVSLNGFTQTPPSGLCYAFINGIYLVSYTGTNGMNTINGVKFLGISSSSIYGSSGSSLSYPVNTTSSTIAPAITSVSVTDAISRVLPDGAPLWIKNGAVQSDGSVKQQALIVDGKQTISSGANTITVKPFLPSYNYVSTYSGSGTDYVATLELTSAGLVVGGSPNDNSVINGSMDWQTEGASGQLDILVQYGARVQTVGSWRTSYFGNGQSQQYGVFRNIGMAAIRGIWEQWDTVSGWNPGGTSVGGLEVGGGLNIRYNPIAPTSYGTTGLFLQSDSSGNSFIQTNNGSGIYLQVGSDITKRMSVGSTGNVNIYTLTAGNGITATTGNITATAGSITAGNGDVTASGNVYTNNGIIGTASTKNITLTPGTGGNGFIFIKDQNGYTIFDTYSNYGGPASSSGIGSHIRVFNASGSNSPGLRPVADGASGAKGSSASGLALRPLLAQYFITDATGSGGTSVTYTTSFATQPFSSGQNVTIFGFVSPNTAFNITGTISSVAGSSGAWTFTITGTGLPTSTINNITGVYAKINAVGTVDIQPISDNATTPSGTSKIINVANGTSSTDAATFGQIPTSASSIGGLLTTNNLSELTGSAVTARGNIGAFGRSILSISSATTAGSNLYTDYVYFITGTTTITLPTAVSNTNKYTIKNIDSSLYTTVATTSSQTIDGSATVTIKPYTSLDFISNGTNWYII